jgi:hypothetical protein
MKNFAGRFLPEAVMVIVPFVASAVQAVIGILIYSTARVMTDTAFNERVVCQSLAMIAAADLGITWKSISTLLSAAEV